MSASLELQLLLSKSIFIKYINVNYRNKREQDDHSIKDRIQGLFFLVIRSYSVICISFSCLECLKLAELYFIFLQD